MVSKTTQTATNRNFVWFVSQTRSQTLGQAKETSTLTYFSTESVAEKSFIDIDK